MFTQRVVLVVVGVFASTSFAACVSNRNGGTPADDGGLSLDGASPGSEDGAMPGGDSGAQEASTDTSTPDGNGPGDDVGNGQDAASAQDASDGGGITAACVTCISTSNCGSGYTTCTADVDCPPIAQCWVGCGPYLSASQICETGCVTGHSNGFTQASLLGDCAARQCAGSCPWATPLAVCDSCVFGADPTDMDTCYADATCWTWYTCVKECGSDVTCFNSCGAGDGNTQVILEPMQTTCESACMTP